MTTALLHDLEDEDDEVAVAAAVVGMTSVKSIGDNVPQPGQ